MPIDSDKTFLRLYMGTDENAEEFLCLDLKIPRRIVPLWISPTSLNNCTPKDLLGYLTKALNEASLYTRNLGIRLKFDGDTIGELVEDFSKEEKRDLIRTIKETKV